MGNGHPRAAALIAALVLSGCTAAPGNGPSGSSRTPDPSPTVSSASGRPSVSPSASAPKPTPSTPAPTAPPSSTAPSVPPADLSTVTPLPKVQRPGATAAPTVSAAAAGPTAPVTYADGVSLRIASVEFGKETKEGPGHFPGREFAILSLQLVNHGKQPIDLSTTVITVLDSDDQQVAPVYVEEADVADFSGTVAPGASTSARYAFAVPEASRSRVTVIVDFDSVHTSAVFHGELK